MQGSVILNEAWLPERETRWMDDALCGFEPVDFFPDPPKNSEKSEIARYNQKVSLAKSVCARCPVRAECLKDATDRDEREGIWGGENFYVPARERIRRNKAS